ncbi:YadA-like family protein [Phascolarctobacterium faecium]|uniref:YadA-like family protein n=2 Tax=Phascolarctobacterium TaxID=33024 RepID=UPI0027B92507|nr:YadA-like family protein [Phascolarctobacterium faecium]
MKKYYNKIIGKNIALFLGIGVIALSPLNILEAAPVFNSGAGTSSTIAGENNVATGAASNAIGYENEASEKYSSAVGSLNKASGEYSNALGYNNEASGDSSSAFGRGNEASGNRSSAFGYGNRVSAANSTAVGNNNVISVENSVALGNNTNISVGNSVALGNGSTATGLHDVSGHASAGSWAGVGDAAGVISVGKSGETRQIQNVAAGEVSATSTDAVNGSQLYQVERSLSNVDRQINRLGDEIDGVGALSAAMAGLHPRFQNGNKGELAMAYGSYGGQSAYAVGGFYAPNEKVMFSVGMGIA